MTAPPPAEVKSLVFFIPCELKNYANHGGHWTGKAGYQKRLRNLAHIICRQTAWPMDLTLMGPEAPKCVTVTAYVWNYFDEHDGLRNACKPIIDGLVRARILDDDGPKSGHLILYTQVIERTRRGVQITVGPR